MPSDVTDTYQKPDPGGAIALQAINGTLDQDVAVPCTPNGDCSPPAITWTYPPPEPNGAAGGARFVLLDTPALGIDPSVRKIAGPLLVRAGTGSRPEVVARYDLGTWLTVATPTVTCDVPAETKLPSCDRLITYALQQLPSSADATAIEVHAGDWPCPSGGTCPSAPPDQRASVIVRSPAGDWEVGLSFDARGNGLDIVQMPVASSYPVPASASVTCGLDPGTKLPSCNEVVAEALNALQSTGTIQSIEVGQGSYCPPGYACPTVEADRAHVIVRAAYGDWLVDLAYGPDGKLVSATPRPLSSADASPAPSFAVTTSSGTPWAACRLVLNAPASDVSCDAAIAAAVSVMPSGTTVVSAEFVPGTECPPWEKCQGVPYDSKSGHVMVKVASGAYLWVPVKLGSDSFVVASSPIPAPSGWPTTSLMP
jgi:hypothetical protein